MSRSQWVIAAFVATAALGAVGVAWIRADSKAPPAEVGATPHAARGLLCAQPFVLEKPYAHTWRKEQPSVDAGWLVVLDVDPEWVVPRQTYEPVLYVGDQTAERVNQGDRSGHVVAIVPSKLDPATGMPTQDLAASPIWFGTPELPERVDAARIAAERVLATRARIGPPPTALVAQAEARGGKLAVFADRTELSRYAATLITVWSPEEYDAAQTMLAPLVR